MEGQCDAWRDVTENLLIPPSEEFFISKLSVSFEVYDYSTLTTRSKVVTCTNAKAISVLVEELINGQDSDPDSDPVEYHCDNESWRVFTCNTARVLCINCKYSCEPTVTCPGAGDVTSYQINPCESQCEDRGRGGSYVNAWGVLSADFEEKILYPQFLPVGSLGRFHPLGHPLNMEELLSTYNKPSVVETGKDYTMLQINMTGQGTVHCSAFQNSSDALPSVMTILNNEANNYNLASIQIEASHVYNVQNLNLTGLTADMDYNVYCFTEDFMSHYMDILEARGTKVSIRTSCCRELLITETFVTVDEFSGSLSRRLNTNLGLLTNTNDKYNDRYVVSSNKQQNNTNKRNSNSVIGFKIQDINANKNNILRRLQSSASTFTMVDEDAFEFQVEALPAAGLLTVKAILHYANCDDMITLEDRVLSSNGIVEPSEFSFYPNSFSKSSKFVVRTRSGCYGVRLMAIPSGGATPYNNVTTTFSAIKSTNAPPEPRMVDAQLSSDGQKIVINLSKNSDRGITKEPDYLQSAGFGCDSVLTFNGSINATCNWPSRDRLEAKFSPNQYLQRAMVGEMISFREDTIRAHCVVGGDVTQLACDRVPYASLQLQQPLKMPDIPITPNVIILVSRTMSVCNNMFIDASQSRGKGSLNWAGGDWTVEMIDPDTSTILYPDPTDYSEVSQFNSLRYRFSTLGTGIDGMISVPSTSLRQGTTYRITLTLTNSLGISGTGVALVTVAASSATPSVVITGNGKGGARTRDESISLFANSSISLGSCTGVSSLLLNYKWKIYGGREIIDIVSTSKDERFFKIAPFTLDPAIDYKIQVTVSVPAPAPLTGILGWSTASTSLLIRRGSLMPIITGGSRQKYSSMSSEIVLDARDSYDQDYPDGSSSETATSTAGAALTYSWTCQTRYPTIGEACIGFQTSQQSSAAFTLLTFPRAQKDIDDETLAVEPFFLPGAYLFTVNIENSLNTAVKSVSSLVILLEEDLPKLGVSLPQKKYDVNEKIILTGSLTTKFYTFAEWVAISDVPGGVLSNISSTTNYKRFELASWPGASLFQLSIKPNTLLAGAVYTFQLNAFYPNATTLFQTKNPNDTQYNLDSWPINTQAFEADGGTLNTASIVVRMNSPPEAGTVSIFPSYGTALNTKFLFKTSSWRDDPEDYPLKFGFGYFLLDDDETSGFVYSIKVVDSIPYARATVGAGHQSKFYLLNIVGSAVDIYGSVGKAYTTVVVQPISQNQLSTAAADSFDSAFDTKDPVGVSNVITAVSNAMNKVSCSVPHDCDLLNRRPCSQVAKTCGPCKSGYVGQTGAANTYCGLQNDLLPTGARCELGLNFSTCASGLCNNNFRCEPALKTCKNNCTMAQNGMQWHGVCTFVDQEDQELPKSQPCLTNDAFCRPVCQCYSAYAGADCSLTQAEMTSNRQLREDLCVNLNKTIAMQDVELSVVSARATSIADILADLTQVSDTALVTCVSVLSQTVLGSPDLVGDRVTASMVAAALSNVLEKGNGLTGSVRTAAEISLSALTVGVQSTLAVGEEPISIFTEAVRVVASLQSEESLKNAPPLTIPLTDFETFEGFLAPSLQINDTQGTAIGALGLTLMKLKREEGGRKSGNASSVALETQRYTSAASVGGSTRRRRLISLYRNSPSPSVGLDNTVLSYGSGVTGDGHAYQFLGKNGFLVTVPSFRDAHWLKSLSLSEDNSDQEQYQSAGLVSGTGTGTSKEVSEADYAIGAMSTSASSSGLGVTVVLYNTAPIQYNRLDPEKSQVVCYKVQDTPYMVTKTCLDSGFTYQVQCSGKRSVFNNTCPGYEERPICTVWDDISGSFLPSDECEVQSFDSESTTCLCKPSGRRRSLSDGNNRQSNRRGLQTSSSSENSYSSEMIVARSDLVIVNYAAKTYISVKNNMILLSVGAFVLFFSIGLLVFAWWDDIERRKAKAARAAIQQAKDDVQLHLTMDKRVKPQVAVALDTGRSQLSVLSQTSSRSNKSNKLAASSVSIVKDGNDSEGGNSDKEKIPEKATHSRRIANFFDSLLPDEFRPGRGHVLFFNRLMVEHTWLPLVAEFREDTDGRAVRWAGATLGRMASYIFFITILAASQFADDGTCEAIINEEICLGTFTPFVGTSMCSWDAYSQGCFFTIPTYTMLNIIVYGMMVYLFVAPVAKLQDYFIQEATKLPWFAYSPFVPIERNFVWLTGLIKYHCWTRWQTKVPKILTEEELDAVMAAKMKPSGKSGKMSNTEMSGKIVPVSAEVEEQLSIQEGQELDQPLGTHRSQLSITEQSVIKDGEAISAEAAGGDDTQDKENVETGETDGEEDQTDKEEDEHVTVNRPDLSINLDDSNHHTLGGDIDDSGSLATLILAPSGTNNANNAYNSGQEGDKGELYDRYGSPLAVPMGGADKAGDVVLTKPGSTRSTPRTLLQGNTAAVVPFAGAAGTELDSEGEGDNKSVHSKHSTPRLKPSRQNSSDLITPLSARSTSSVGSHHSIHSLKNSTIGNNKHDLSINLKLETIVESTPEALLAMNKLQTPSQSGSGRHGSDEFIEAQTTIGKLLRAARLTKAQHQMEFATPHEEASLLAHRIMKDKKRSANFIVTKMVYEVDRPRVKSRFEDMVENELDRYGEMSDEKIITAITTARSRAIAINKEVENMIYDEDREAHLMKHFIMNNLSGYSKGVAVRYMFSRNTTAQSNEEKSTASLVAAYSKQFFYIALMLALTGAQFLYVMVSGGAILGTRASELWILMLAYCIVLDAFLMQFAITFFRCVILRNTFTAEVTWLTAQLKHKARIIMMRTFGNLRDATSYQQHLNPACRVARLHPHLPVSRLLLSISDRDVSISPEDGKAVYQSIGAMPIYYRWVNFLAFAASWSFSIQDTVTEMTCIFLVNIMAIALWIINEQSFSAFVGASAVILCIALNSYIFAFYRFLKKQYRHFSRWLRSHLKYVNM